MAQPFTMGKASLHIVAAIVVLMLTPLVAVAQSACAPATLSQDTDFRLDLGRASCAFVDPDRDLTLADLATPEGIARFEPVTGGLIDFGFGSARYWIKVRLQNSGDTPGTWWITHDIPVADEVRVRLLPEGGGAGEARTLLTLLGTDPFDARAIEHRHLASEVTLAAGETATLFVDYHTGQATEMPFFAESVPAFLARTQTETVQIIALIALISGMGIISTVYLYSLFGRQALIYGAYAFSGVALLFHMEGYSFQFLWPNAPGLNSVGLALLGLTSISLGTLFVDNFTQMRRHHPWLHYTAQGIVALMMVLCVGSVFLIDTVWYKVLTLPLAGVAALLQVFMAYMAFRREQPGAGMLLLGFGSLAASLIFGMVGYLTEALFEQELAGIAIRMGFLAEAAAFSTAIAQRIIAARRERDASLREQLRLSEERLHLSEALRRAEVDRREAASDARESREALASAAHDIRQPLASIQMALSGGDAAMDRIVGSLNYLEEIVRVGLEEHTPPRGAGDEDPVNEGSREHFRTDIVLRNIEAMFGADALAQGAELAVMSCTETIVADPLALMRMVGNLVSNALQHGQASRVLVGARRSDNAMTFEVHDNGRGLSAAELERIRLRGEKGAGSGGHGLGLAIVSDLAKRHGFTFEIASLPGRGTVARIKVPTCLPLRTTSRPPIFNEDVA